MVPKEVRGPVGPGQRSTGPAPTVHPLWPFLCQGGKKVDETRLYNHQFNVCPSKFGLVPTPRSAILYSLTKYVMYVCTEICISWSFGKYEFSGRRLRFVKRLQDFKGKSCARKLNEGAARFPVNNWTPLKHKHAKEQMHSQARAA